MKKNFKDKIVYITGGSTGIGLAVAKLLYSLGSHIYLFARTLKKLEDAIDELTEFQCIPDQKAGFKILDVANPQMVSTVMNEAVSEFGVPDILINCAGRAYPNYFENISYDQFDETMKINLYGIRNVIYTLLPVMKKHGSGYIVNTSSVAGFLGTFGYTDYCASKFALIGFSETLKSEIKRYNITVSVLCPPDTDTPGFKTENKTKPPETRAISESIKLLSADKVAAGLIKGMIKKQFIIIPGFDGKLTYFMKRHFPWIVDMVLNSQVKKAQLLQ